MRSKDFDYDLPKSFIAQNPVSPRDYSKLLVFNTKKDEVFHKHFFNIIDFLKKGDVLVVNESKVIPARILFDLNNKEKEIFLLNKKSDFLYQVMVRPGKWFKKGKKFTIKDEIDAEVLEIYKDGTRLLKLQPLAHDKDFESILHGLGEAPFPPYITNTNADFSNYQTIYASKNGSIACPTAGLHFTDKLLGRIFDIDVQIEKVVLHVGRGTFQPVSVDRIDSHKMHSEYYEISASTADNLNKAREEGRRIIAVGTTSVRAIESNFDSKVGFSPWCGETNIFIYPGYQWKAVDALVTNFHLPKSTLLMLVSSFLEKKKINNPVEKLLGLYEMAKSQSYRFYSFGDAMFIF